MATNSGIPMAAVKFPIEIMETDVAAVVGGGADYGWIVGTPSGLAAVSNTQCLFDLGPDWKQYPIVCVACNILGPSTTAVVQFFSRDDATQAINNNRRLALNAGAVVNGNTLVANIVPGAAAGADWILRPMGRYLVVAINNTDAANAVGVGSKFTVAAYPN